MRRYDRRGKLLHWMVSVLWECADLARQKRKTLLPAFQKCLKMRKSCKTQTRNFRLTPRCGSPTFIQMLKVVKKTPKTGFYPRNQLWGADLLRDRGHEVHTVQTKNTKGLISRTANLLNKLTRNRLGLQY